MLAVPVANEWVETVQLFGDLEKVVTEALQAYAVEQCQQRIQKAATKIANYNQKYRCDYETFKQVIRTDEGFLSAVEARNPLWEEDAMEWEYWLEEQQAWLNRLGDISRR
jgi:hypothetical protein